MLTTFVRRVLGVLGLDARTFEEVEVDRSATPQAVLVVLLASAGAGLANAGLTEFDARQMVVGAGIALAAWLTWAVLIYYLGTRILPSVETRADTGQLLRTMGFAAAPGMLRAFEILGGTRWILFPLTSAWMLVAMVIGVRQALDYPTTGRAIAVCALGWAVSTAVAAGIGVLLAVPVY